MKPTLLLAALLLLLHPSARAQETPTPVVITVQPGARQTFRGLGASLFGFTPSSTYNAQVPRDEQVRLARLLWHDARLRSVRLWVHPDDFYPAAAPDNIGHYVDGWIATRKLPDAVAAGAVNLILAPDNIPAAMGDGHGLIKDAEVPNYAALLAGFVRVFRDQTGILINYAAVLNEPNDRPVKLSDAQWPVMIQEYRKALDAGGLQAVQIIAPESANCGGDAYAVVDSLHADPVAWQALTGVATHSYNNAATEDMAARAVGKQYWITEAGGITDADEDAHDALQAASVASRFLNDVNHRVTDWQFFIGYEQADPHGNTGRILKYDVHPYRLTVLQKYFYLQQLSQTFDVGAVFRHSLSSLEGEMTYTYGKKPRVNAAVAKNPDGTWAVGLSNYTSQTFQDADDPKDFGLHNSGYRARSFVVTLVVPELVKAGPLRYAVCHSAGTIGNQRDGFVVMRDGRVTVPVAPLELVTLRSTRKLP